MYTVIIIKPYIITNSYCNKVHLHIEHHQDESYNEDSLKLANSRCHYDFRKYSFSITIVNIWSSLPASVISVDNVNTFHK